MARVSALQLTTGPNIQANLARVDELLAKLPKDNEHIVVLPECCLIFGCSDFVIGSQAELYGQGPMQSGLAELAQKHQIYLVAGTIPLQSVHSRKYTASNLVFSPEGECLAHYQKMHLFDVDVSDNTGRYRESARTEAGKDVVALDLGFVHLGLSVCYDVRFPELFRLLGEKGANVLTVPAAFTVNTGEAHWHALLRARAIENQCYVVAAAQSGTHENGRKTYGHSLIISPWGEVVEELGQGQGWVSASVDMPELEKIRRNMPVWQHRRLKDTAET